MSRWHSDTHHHSRHLLLLALLFAIEHVTLKHTIYFSYLILLIVSHSLLECRLHEDRSLCLLCSLLCSQHPQQGLAHECH